jgi:HlyD family secretion protein
MDRKRLLVAGLGLLAVLAIVGFVVHRRGEDGTAFRLATVERGNVQQTVSSTGTLSAVKTVQVGTQVSGKVAAQFADFNDHVKKGQLLARIDPTLQQQAVRDAEAGVARAQAQLVQARAEYNRNKPLAEQKFISASEFETIQTNLAVAQAAVRSAQVALERAKQNLSYTNIYAPIDGVVVERNDDVGQTVAASLSAPQIYLIAQDLKQMQILAAVDESDIGSIKAGQKVMFSVQAYPNRDFDGVVDEVRLQSKLTDNVVSYTVVVRVDNTPGLLLPGMTATVQFITGSAADVLTVPNAALRYRPSPEELEAAGLPATYVKDTARRRRGTGDEVESGARGGAGGEASRRQGGGGAGEGRGAPNGARQRRAGGTGSATIWTLDARKLLHPIRVRTGLTDGQRTQVSSDSLHTGMQVVVGSVSIEAGNAASNNPLAPQRGRRGRGF